LIVEFGLLGPLLVRDDSRDIAVSAPRQRVLLAALLLAGAGRPVAFDELGALLWDGRPPASARGALHSAVQRLRVTLGAAGPDLVRTCPSGYLIDIGPDALDVHRFEALAGQGEAAAEDGRWTQAAGLLAQALALWRGDPLADVPSALLRDREAQHLAERRLRAVSARIDADLHLGRHEALVPELTRLTRDYPLREGFHRQLMLALYLAGRQADALAGYRHIRQLLIAELGTEPAPGLQDLHLRILAADASLAPEPRPGAPGSAPAPGSGSGSGSGSGPTVPHQLPIGAAQFTGRGDELALLTGLLTEVDDSGGTVVISAVGGAAGVGKTALAVHWAHQVADRFPDGQLYANLCGFGSAAAPADPPEIIRGFLDALGAEPERIPVGLDAQAALYRSLLAGRRMLIVLDNARDADQVRPLVPGCPGCLVLVTSRRQLPGLAAVEGAQLLNLDVLSDAEARELLARRLGPQRAAAEPGTVDELARLCGRLPLALAITAGRAAAQPGHPLSALAAELGDERGRLDALETGDVSTSLRHVFSWSYQQLSDPAARLFRLLGLHPGPDITAPAAASLTGISPNQAAAALHELVRVSLLAQPTRGRYALHDLLHAYASEQARAIDSSGDRDAATRRVLDHYLHTASTAARLIKPTKDALILDRPQAGVAPERLATGEEALAWLRAERQVLANAVWTAAASRFGAHAWQIGYALVDYLDRQGRWSDLAALHHTVLAASQNARDLAGQAHAHQTLGLAATRLGASQDALTHLCAALDLYRQADDPIGQARTLLSYGRLLAAQGQHREAITAAEQAGDLFRAAGHQAGQANALNNAGWYEAHLGHLDQALARCREARGLFRELGDRAGEARAWDSLGLAHQLLGDHADAVAAYRHAIRLYLDCGDRHNQGETLVRLGDAQHAAGQPGRARDAWRQALAILDDSDRADAGRIRAKLAGLDASDVTAGPA
jgi:DNA-binding SARP family transcriptional activator